MSCPDHPVGKYKARIFASALGLTAAHADVLATALAGAAATAEAEILGADSHGQRFRIRFEFRFRGKSAMIVSGWIVPADGSPTRLASAYVA